MNYALKQSLAERVGERMRILRKERGLTLVQVADKVQCGKGQLSRIECGRQEATLKTIELLAGGLDVPIGDFFVEDLQDQIKHIELLGKLDRLREHPAAYALVLKFIDGLLQEVKDQ